MVGDSVRLCNVPWLVEILGLVYLLWTIGSHILIVGLLGCVPWLVTLGCVPWLGYYWVVYLGCSGLLGCAPRLGDYWVVHLGWGYYQVVYFGFVELSGCVPWLGVTELAPWLLYY